MAAFAISGVHNLVRTADKIRHSGRSQSYGDLNIVKL
jgi:hypothetical protein